MAMLVVGTQLGCSSAEATTEGESTEDYTAVSSGLWALDGPAAHGDIELLQLARRNYASIVREAPALEAMSAGAGAAPSGAARAGSAPASASRSATGNLTRGTAATPTIALNDTAADASYSISALGEKLELTTADGRVLTYRRSYRLYCVPTDRSVEATVLLELGKEPKLVGVNGDGRVFPTEGTRAATVKTDVLFRLQDYVVVSNTGSTSVTVKLPWSNMSKSEIEGTLAITGAPNAVAPTPITCERVATP
jgi:hypothetical protein